GVCNSGGTIEGQDTADEECKDLVRADLEFALAPAIRQNRYTQSDFGFAYRSREEINCILAKQPFVNGRGRKLFHLLREDICVDDDHRRLLETGRLPDPLSCG